MRTDNGKIKNLIVSVYFVLFVLAILLATIFRAFSEIANSTVSVFAVLVLVFIGLFLSVYLIAKYFEYDSDGVKVVVINKGMFLSDKFKYRTHQVEFFKSELVGFKFVNYLIYKRLVLYIKSENKSTVKAYFNVSLVTRRKRKYVGQSLSKMVKNNKNKV